MEENFDELFEKLKLVNQMNEEIYEKYCALLKAKTRDADVSLMKAIIHNKVLLMVILSKLGMKDDEIDKLSQTIYNTLDKEMNENDTDGSNEEKIEH